MKILFVIFWSISLIYTLNAAPLVIVTNHTFGRDSLDKEEIKALYTAKKFRIGNQKIITVNLAIDHPLRERFENNFLEEERSSLTKIWLQAHYLGYRPPKVFKSQESIAEFISKVDSALGYMEETTAQKYRLKILYKEQE